MSAPAEQAATARTFPCVLYWAGINEQGQVEVAELQCTHEEHGYTHFSNRTRLLMWDSGRLKERFFSELLKPTRQEALARLRAELQRQAGSLRVALDRLEGQVQDVERVLAEGAGHG